MLFFTSLCLPITCWRTFIELLRLVSSSSACTTQLRVVLIGEQAPKLPYCNTNTFYTQSNTYPTYQSFVHLLQLAHQTRAGLQHCTLIGLAPLEEHHHWPLLLPSRLLHHLSQRSPIPLQRQVLSSEQRTHTLPETQHPISFLWEGHIPNASILTTFCLDTHERVKTGEQQYWKQQQSMGLVWLESSMEPACKCLRALDQCCLLLLDALLVDAVEAHHEEHHAEQPLVADLRELPPQHGHEQLANPQPTPLTSLKRKQFSSTTRRSTTASKSSRTRASTSPSVLLSGIFVSPTMCKTFPARLPFRLEYTGTNGLIPVFGSANFRYFSIHVYKTFISFRAPPNSSEMPSKILHLAPLIPIILMQKKSASNKDNQEAVWKWLKEGTLIYGDSGVQTESKLIAGFDMDGTLISTKSGAKFPKNAEDWKWWDASVVPKLKQLSEEGYRIVIFTNQGGIQKGHTAEKDIQKKIEKLQEGMGVPLTALIASSEDQFRKPLKGMWEFFRKSLNKEEVDMGKSFYCGDSAGRVKGKVKDFNDTDLKFAVNLGLEFKTPEQLFLKQDLKEDYVKSLGFNPRTLPKTGPIFKGEQAEKFVKPEKEEMIIMVGAVGSGKSTFVGEHLKDYTRVNRDSLKTKEKCLKVAEEAMKKKEYVVIDNQNTKKQDREEFIALAKKYKYNVRAFYLEATKELCMHNDAQREYNPNRQHYSKKVGSIPIHTFFKYFEMPTKQEGFDEVKTVSFVAGPFRNPQDEESFYSFVKGKK